MYLSTNPFWLRISTSMRGLLWLCLGVGLALSSRLAVGQEPPSGAGARSDIGDAVEDGALFGDRYTGRSGEAFGALIRAGVSSGPAVGRETSIFPVELMPYAFADKWMFFSDFRGFRATSDDWGGSLGTGLRYHSEGLDRIFGANVYYDYDNSSGALFRDVGFGLETLGKQWDMRANAYFPNATTQKLLSTTFVNGSQAFVDNRITYSQDRLVANALTGVDMEVAVPLPGRVMQRHDVRVAGGWYYYKGEEIAGFAGWKTRVQANLIANLQAQMEITSDSLFDTNVIFGATWTYGGFRQPDGEARSQFNRMTEQVRRNYNVAVGLTTVRDTGIVAVNPNTALPYFVEHVASYATGPAFNGTVTDPFLTVADAQADLAIRDIIFVHADSVFNNTGVELLEQGVRMLGEGDGVLHRVNVATLGSIPVPRATTGVERPLFANSPGDGVTLTSFPAITTTQPTEFSGFRIGDEAVLASGSTGHGIYGNGAKNFLITQTDINFSAGDGIRLENLLNVANPGPVVLRGVRINDPAASATALHVIGNVGGITFGDDPVSLAQGLIDNTGGRAVWIENTNLGSFVNLTGTEITDGIGGIGGQGILIDNSVSNEGGIVTIDTTTITGSTTTGVEIIGGSGIVNFRGALNIAQPTNDAISIHNTLGGSAISFGTAPVAGVSTSNAVTITNRGARGINLTSNAGQVSFFGQVSVTDTVGFLAIPPAIEYQSSSGGALFRTLTLNGGSGDGILISNNTGEFFVTGATTIDNFFQDGVRITNDAANVLFNGLTVSNRGFLDLDFGRGVNVNNSTGTYSFQGTTIINNQQFSVAPAVDIQNNPDGSTSFESLSIFDATRPLPRPLPPFFGGAGLNVVNNPATVSVTTLNVVSDEGIGVFISNAGDSAATPATGGVIINGGTIETTGELPAVDVSDSVINLTFTSVSSADSLTQGIVLLNNVGPSGGDLFTVTGINGASGTGGTITGAIGDGAQFTNTGGVSLSGMNINGNLGDGIQATTSSLAVINSAVTGNAGFGIQTLSTPGVSLFGNTLATNGQSEVQLVAATNEDYSFTIGDPFSANQQTITDVGSDAVVISNQGPAIGRNLFLTVVNNTITTTGAFDTGLLVNWNGSLLPTTLRSGAEVSSNIFNSIGFGATGVQLNLPFATAISSVRISTNTFIGSGTSVIGVDVTKGAGNSNIIVSDNDMRFTGIADRAVRMTLGANSTTTVSGNEIVMNGDLSEALLFPLIQGTSTLTIERNIITIDDGADLFIDERGVHIQAVTGSVTLFGNEDNDIQIYGFRGTGIPYFEAPPNILGTILVNGTPQP